MTDADNTDDLELLINTPVQTESQFGLVWFHGIPTIAGYLILNPIFT